MLLEQPVERTMVFNQAGIDVDCFLQDARTLHIAYGIDENFVRPMGVAIVSILENHPKGQFVFHVMMDALSDAEKENLEKITQKYSSVIIVYFLRTQVFDALPSTEHFTKATYNRFLLPKILQGVARRVIYLDADILCLNRLDALIALDFEGKAAAVVQDINAVAERQIKALHLTDKRYFNAGFIYIDVDLWNEQKISEQALQVSFDYLGKLDWLDQDALNIVLQGKCLYISQKYDYIFDLGAKQNARVLQLPQDVVLVHYAGRCKPWHQWCMHPLRRDFDQYSALSPWRDAALIAPQTYKDMKKMGQSYWNYGQYVKSLLWYAKYSYHKVKEKLFHI